jgi:hypothetical protein
MPNFGTLIGTYGKGIPGSLTVNFAPSGGKNCSDTCQLKKSGLCYATRAEARKPSIKVNLERKAADLSGYLKALLQSRNQITEATWIRISAFGSVPPTGRLSRLQRDLMGSFLRMLAQRDPTTVHFPVETPEKQEAYRVGEYFPRLSLGLNPSPRRISGWLQKGRPVAMAYDPGTREPGYTRAAISGSKTLARDLRRKFPDHNIKVCPSIAGNAKCGACKLCALDGADLVIYPLHA